MKTERRVTRIVRDSVPRQFFRRLAILLAVVAIFASSASAEHTRRWRQATYEEFLKGDASGVAVRSDGHLELAPKFTLLADADASYLWTLKLDSKGTLYATGGSPAKVFRFDENGRPKTVFENGDLSAQAIAFDGSGNLYVGTSPDGKVYKVTPSGEKSVFFDPKTKYIWDLAFGPDGTLYVATGDKGEIFAVAPDGKGQTFYVSDEAHIRVLAFDKKGSLLAGTEPSGRIVRISRPADSSGNARNGVAEGFVLYETPKREVTSLVVAPDGSIYAAAIGETKRSNGKTATTIVGAQGTTVIAGAGGAVVTNQTPMPTPFIAFPPQLSSGIYRIAPDGSPQELWTSREDVVYSLGLNSDGRLLAGTGNNGALLVIDGQGVFAQLAKSGSSQITGIARDGKGKVYVCTANPGKVFSVGPEFQPEGTFESQSFDADEFSRWGRLEWWSPPAANMAKAATSGQPRLEFYVRSGNTQDPGKQWSRWFGPYTKSGTPVEAPSARFVQWKAVIHDGRPGDGIEWVSLAYLPRNVAPVIDGIALQDPGVRVQGISVIQTGQQPSVNLKMPPQPVTAGTTIVSAVTTTKFEAPPQGFAQKGSMSVLWSAHDDNDDDLKYSIYYRGEGETSWKTLKDALDQKFYTWDSTSLPDGAYYLEVVASDEPSNAPGVALKTAKQSERFVIDNTPPELTVQAGVANSQAGHASVSFIARDATSAIDRAQYSIDGGDWTLIDPQGSISDSLEEEYHLELQGLTAGNHSIAVRAYDHFDNVGSAKTSVTVSGPKS